jgi:ubiquinone/menaquinone biosynthesis C-methylase UbiE
MKEKHTGERLETTIYNANAVNHLHRYALASSYIKGKVVLDIASGEGYGSNLMSEVVIKVFGVDIDSDTIAEAKEKYKNGHLEFVVGSASDIPLDTNSVDVVVSFETLEHHDKHDEMFAEIKRVLKPDGLLIISTPDKYYYTDKRNYNNKFHIKELYKSEFVTLINDHFKKHQLLSQSFLNGNSIILDEMSRSTIEFYTGSYSEIKNSNSPPHFLIAICSDGLIKEQNNSIFNGEQLLKNTGLSNTLVKSVYQSNSYKLGHIILYPFKLLKIAIKKIIR